MVPTLRCGLVRSNFFFATASSYLTSRRGAAPNALREVSRHLCVMTEFHRIGRPPRGHRPKFGSVTEHLSEGHAGLYVLRRASTFHAQDVPATRRQVAHHVTEIFLRHDNVDLHDRLEQVRLSLTHRILDRHRAGDLERHVVRVDSVVRAVDQRGNDIDNGIAGDNPGLKRLPDSLFNGWDELPGDPTLRDLVLEYEPAAGLARADIQLGVAELTLATGLADE